MRLPDESAVADLLRWEPPYGVVSVYVDVDPADRGEGWRIELRNGLREAAERGRDGGDRDSRRALEATLGRIMERFPNEARRPEGRAHIGFVEVAPKPRREEWYGTQMAPPGTSVVCDRRPFLRPLVTMLDDGAGRGVAVVSSERVRLLRWALGAIEELADWELEVTMLDWRERKAQRPADPGRAQGATAAGRDQFGQRLEANRDRFLRECGRLAGAALRERDCHELLALGEAERVRELAEGIGDGIELHAVDGHDLISAPTHEVALRVGAALEELNRSRELALVRRVLEEARGGTRGALGLQESFEALQQGRVEHLLFDAKREWSDPPPGLARDGDLPVAERMIELALQTSARVTPVEGDAATALQESEGVAALLRY